jgi:hypothetical protein
MMLKTSISRRAALALGCVPAISLWLPNLLVR